MEGVDEYNRIVRDLNLISDTYSSIVRNENQEEIQILDVKHVVKELMLVANSPVTPQGEETQDVLAQQVTERVEGLRRDVLGMCTQYQRQALTGSILHTLLNAIRLVLRPPQQQDKKLSNLLETCKI